MVGDLVDDRRSEPPYIADERSMLEGWLEYHRTTLLMKCEGVSPEQLKSRPIPSSKLSLHGLVRHMAEVERSWFTRCLMRAPETPPIWYDPEIEDSELEPLDDADWPADLEAWRRECVKSRKNASRYGLEYTGLRRGEECSLRWIYTHMVEEYARHNGHADLIRELVDGTVGC